MKDIIYYGKYRSPTTKLTTMWKKRHLVDKDYITKCGRKVVTEPNALGKYRRKTQWNDKHKDDWNDLAVEDCKICFGKGGILIKVDF